MLEVEITAFFFQLDKECLNAILLKENKKATATFIPRYLQCKFSSLQHCTNSNVHDSKKYVT